MRVTEIANPYTSLLRIKNPQRRGELYSGQFFTAGLTL